MAFAEGKSLSQLLDELDYALENRIDIIKTKEEKIKSMKDMLVGASPSTRLEVCSNIFKEYYGYRTDSALVYAKIVNALSSNPFLASPQSAQEAQISLARCYIVSGSYDLAEKMLTDISGSLMPPNKALFYHTMTTLYIWRTDCALLNEDRTTFYSHVLQYRDSVCKYDADPVQRIQNKSLRMLDDDLPKAKDMLRNVMPQLRNKHDQRRFLANSLASCYKRLGVRDSACYYYAVSAISDIHCGVLEQTSLRELALLLFEAGDINHAYHYTNCCLEDAKSSGVQLRMMQMASDMPVIMETYQNLVNKQKTGLTITIIILAIAAICMVLVLIYMYRIQRRLHDTQRNLLEAKNVLEQNKQQLQTALSQVSTYNDRLKEANMVKESFVAEYMKLCSESLSLLENYRHSVLKVAVGGANINKVVSVLRDDSMAEKEFKRFMHSFDESFLKLYPTFIDEFNTLIIPEERIVLPEGKLMNTDLRIYALIRLGITESEEIGRFIGKSIKTVYNYRTRMRNKAIGNRDTFDDDVQNLCSIDAPQPELHELHE